MTKLVALLVEDDSTFALPAWHAAIPMMEKRGLLVTHVAVVPSRVAKYQGARKALWYLKVFGVANAARLGLFAMIEAKRRQHDPRTWEELALTHGLVLGRFPSANAVETQEFLRNSQCDVLHVLAAADLKRAVVDIARAGTIAHHASLLPACRGSFPYFWARLYGEPVGHSMHTVTPGAAGEGGPILAQKEAIPAATRSMLAFQVWAAREYPQMAVEATERLLTGKRAPRVATVEPSYFTLPTRRDRLEFEQNGGRISTWRDLRLTVTRRQAPLSFSFPEAPPAPRSSSAASSARPLANVIQMPARV